MNHTASTPTNRVKDSMSDIEKYTRRRPSRHLAEMRLVSNTFPQLSANASVLDAPCGAGRISAWLAEQGYQVNSLDLGNAAANYTRKRLNNAGFDVNAQQGNIFHLPWYDRCFDAVICFRLLHHFSDQNLRTLLLQELARVSDAHLLVSYLSPWSATGIKRRIKKRATGKSCSQNHTSLEEIKSALNESGFEMVRNNAQSRFLHSLQLAHFQRK